MLDTELFFLISSLTYKVLLLDGFVVVRVDRDSHRCGGYMHLHYGYGS